MIRQSGDPKEMIGERYDVLRERDGEFKIASRFVVLTATVIDAPRLRILF
jgi:hypothetical protein